MIDPRFVDRNALRLVGQHPTLVAKMTNILDVMDRLGFPMIVTDGVRTAAEQNALWHQGRDTPGKIVTYRDGITVKSNHQPWADGFGHAVDCCFLVDLDADGQVDDASWDLTRPWDLFGRIVRSQGLAWGGDWTPDAKKDRPHVELLA
jgi:peptidoglycan L-alanyl-D-glutamate endopeptidase CwlK